MKKRRKIAAGWPTGMSLFLVIFFLLSTGCVVESSKPNLLTQDKLTLYAEEEAVAFEPILSRYSFDPSFQSDLQEGERADPDDLFGPFHLHARNTYSHSDGSTTIHYYLEPGIGKKIAKLLVGHMKGLHQVAEFSKAADNTAPSAPNQIALFPGFVKDRRVTSASGPEDEFMKMNHGLPNVVNTSTACDLLLVRATKETLLDVESFIRKFLVEVPQIEVKIRVLEVYLADNTQYGLTSSLSKVTGGDPFLQSLTTHFNTEEMSAAGGFTLDDLASWFDPGRADVDPGFQGSLFVVEGVHDKIRLQAAIELLQRTGSAEVLNAPKVRVMNGHKAIIETGSDIPIAEANVKATTTEYKYNYKHVGVTTVILPFLRMDGSLRIQVTTSVSTITSEKTFTTATGSVTVPVISDRGASTIVDVKEDQAFLLAGLLHKTEIEVVSKVPLLGDIPILGYLFKSKNKEFQKTQIVFYIEPRVVKPTEVIYGLGE